MMSTYRSLAFTLIAISACANAVSAYTPFFDGTKPPKLALEKAVQLAETKLEQEKTAVLYCRSVIPFPIGNNDCDWHFELVGNDGRHGSCVKINMSGVATAARQEFRLLDSPAVRLHSPKDFEDLRRTIEVLIAKELPVATLTVGKNELTVSYKTKKYRLRLPKKDASGRRSEVDEVAPEWEPPNRNNNDAGNADQPERNPFTDDGVWLRITLADAVDWRSSFHWAESSKNWPYEESPIWGPPWQTIRESAYLTETKKVIALEWRLTPDDPAGHGGYMNFAYDYADDREYLPKSGKTKLLFGIRKEVGPSLLWNSMTPPRVSIKDALTIARKALGNELDRRHCSSIRLWGDPRGDAEYGTWRVIYTAKDATRKLVTVDMERRATVEDWRKAVP
jgi:hypothetical protein